MVIDEPSAGSWQCPTCANRLFLDNTVCLQCGSAVGFRPDLRCMAIDLARHQDDVGDRATGVACANAASARCNWLLPAGSGETLCRSCRFTIVRPSSDDPAGAAGYISAESMKRRALAQLGLIGLTLKDRAQDPQAGLGFAFLMSSPTVPVTTGHVDGVITIDVAEADDAHRERVRVQMGERYRTIIGHIRHELGHFFWPRLVASDSTRLDRFRKLFGDERDDYDAAKDRWYRGERPSMHEQLVSTYAHMHPHEDWAESFAHFLLIDDALATAALLGIEPPSDVGALGLAGASDVTRRIDDWDRISVALNEVSRATGQRDLYPFVITEPVRDRLVFVHECITSAVAAPTL